MKRVGKERLEDYTTWSHDWFQGGSLVAPWDVCNVIGRSAMPSGYAGILHRTPLRTCSGAWEPMREVRTRKIIVGRISLVTAYRETYRSYGTHLFCRGLRLSGDGVLNVASFNCAAGLLEKHWR